MIAMSGCGRVSFDPLGDSGPPSLHDSSTSSGDAEVSDGAPDGTPLDALGAACSNAIAVTVGTTTALSTCTGQDVLDTCSSNKQELVLRFVPPASGGYTFRALDPGTQNISNSTARLDPGCTMQVGGCTGILGTSLTAGQPVYFAIEAAAGACAMIEFQVTQSNKGPQAVNVTRVDGK